MQYTSCARAVTPHSFGTTAVHTHTQTDIILFIFFTRMHNTHYNIIKVNENTSAGRQKTNEPQISYDIIIIIIVIMSYVASFGVVAAAAHTYTLNGHLHIQSPNQSISYSSETMTMMRPQRTVDVVVFRYLRFSFFRNSMIKRSNRGFPH